MNNWYPLRFRPILKEKIWGGNALKTFLHKTDEDRPYGESWEIADLPDDQSIITNGIHKGKALGTIVSAFAKAVLGTSVTDRFGSDFPLLIKYIDASDDLSVQLHPDDTIAAQQHKGKGKTEMWYILKAEPDAKLIIGFKEEITITQFDAILEKGSIHEHLQYIPVKEGDAFFINAGLIHAIGKGVVLAEIQQTSDITYRVFDYDRKQKDGTLRDLHINDARRALNFKTPMDYKLTYDDTLDGVQKLKHCPYFKTDIVLLTTTSSYRISRTDSFTVLIMIDGSIQLMDGNEEETLTKGQTTLIPAACKEINIESKNAKFLEVYL